MEAKKSSKKAVKKAAKKTTTAKKVIKKAAKKAVKKAVETEKTTTKKKATAKKAVKKTVAKVVKKTVVKKTAASKSTIRKKAVNQLPVEPVVKANEIEVKPEPKEIIGEQPVQPVVPASDTEQYWQDNYDQERLVLLIRDPYWCFAYWDVSSELQTTIIQSVQQDHARLLLRTYDVTDIQFDGNNAHRSMDIEVSEEASNWYINVWESDRAYCVDLGLLYPDGKFKTLLRSNIVTTPRDSISPVVDEEWMVVDEMFDQLYQTAGAGDVGRSSEAITKYMLKRVRADVTSGGLASMGSEGGRPKPDKPEDFWLVVHTELIVYGATEPDAKLTIQGQPMPLNNDGTFSVRFALPDGKQIIPVKARNAGETQERTITPVVEKSTE